MLVVSILFWLVSINHFHLISLLHQFLNILHLIICYESHKQMSQQQKLLLLLLQLLLLLLLLTAMQLLKTTPHLYNIWTKYCMSVGLKNPECLWLFVPITHSLKNKLCLNTAIFMLIPPGWLRCNNNINKRAGLYKALARISITEKDVFHNYCMCSMGLLSITRQMLLLSCLH